MFFMLHILELPLNSINYRFVHNIATNSISVLRPDLFLILFIYLIQHAYWKISLNTQTVAITKLN